MRVVTSCVTTRDGEMGSMITPARGRQGVITLHLCHLSPSHRWANPAWGAERGQTSLTRGLTDNLIDIWYTAPCVVGFYCLLSSLPARGDYCWPVSVQVQIYDVYTPSPRHCLPVRSIATINKILTHEHNTQDSMVIVKSQTQSGRVWEGVTLQSKCVEIRDKRNLAFTTASVGRWKMI